MDMTVECDGAGNTAALNAWLAANGNAGAASDICSGVTWSNDFTELSDARSNGFCHGHLHRFRRLRQHDLHDGDLHHRRHHGSGHCQPGHGHDGGVRWCRQ